MCFAVGASEVASAVEQSFDPWAIKEVAGSLPWKRLLHYKKRFPFGNLTSEVSDGSFFFSSDGKTEAEDELRATLAAFQENRQLKTLRGIELPARCAFPARWEFLRNQLHIDLPNPACPTLDAFLNKIDARSITLVFSSSYPNSPPSMFGHTFIRVNSAKGDPLSDFGINYSALAGSDENAVAFAWLGLMGGYPGHFAVEPYYLKVNEYNHSESRDLWEYELNLSRDEVRTFLLHLWELDQTAVFKYYFADDNCSYRLLTMLEVARSDWFLSDFAIHAIPAETVKRVTRTKGAVRGVHFRPSIRRQLNYDFKKLSPEQTRSVDQIIVGAGAPQLEKDPAVLDVAIAYYRYQSFKTEGKLRADLVPRYREVLLQRSKLPVSHTSPMDEADLPRGDTRPDTGHGPYALSAGGGFTQISQNATGFGEISFKLAYHDLLNSDRGFTRLSHVDFPQVRLRGTAKEFWVERLGILNVTSLFPLTALEKQLSWSFESNYGVPKDLGCLSCHTAVMGASGGFSLDLIERGLVFYTLGGLRTEGGSTLNGFFRFGPTLESALIAQVGPFLKLGLSGVLRTDLAQNYRQKTYVQVQGDLSWNLAQDWDVRAQSIQVFAGDPARGKNLFESRLGLYKYF